MSRGLADVFDLQQGNKELLTGIVSNSDVVVSASSGDEVNNGLIVRTFNGISSGLVVGGVIGASSASWKNVSAIKNDQTVSALIRASRVVIQHSLFFAAVGGTFTGVDAVSENVRGEKDGWNSVIAGAAAGAVMGLKAKRLAPAVGISAAFAIAAGAVELSGKSMTVPKDKVQLTTYQ
eukprot:TRINITY_DN5625_c0_g1_i2.p2 TRINITY_DN5625_c0_g1~~TRINITY_DN5625_c0_g1_i2.p2  ORF type:complete len:178 (+),score=62.81 TRINITY_DN5625_c0_g1_i2:2-535(+)